MSAHIGYNIHSYSITFYNICKKKYYSNMNSANDIMKLPPIL